MGHQPGKILVTSRGVNRIEVGGEFDYEMVDITSESGLNYHVDAFQPEIIINAAAMTEVDRCEKEKIEAWEVNVEGVRNLVRAANRAGARLVHMSSDFVFDGTAGPYKENDRTNPVNFYGNTKVEGERIIVSEANTWTIIRTILVYGYLSAGVRSNFVIWLNEKLRKNEPVKLVTDQYRMPTLAEDLASAILLLTLHGHQGIFHVSGEESVSIYEFGQMVCRVFELDEDLISPVRSGLFNEQSRRPARTGFNLDKIKESIDFQSCSLQKGLEIIRTQMAL
jgi:dTDP-4-dehydrorhamnose reductase